MLSAKPLTLGSGLGARRGLSKVGLARSSSVSLHRQTSKCSPICLAGGGSGGSVGGSGSGGGGGGGGDGDGKDEEGKGAPVPAFGLGALLKGWEERVAYDPEFPVKMFLEQVIGVGFSVAGDMSSRPNWGLNELDFVFSTLVVGSILNFTIMFTLAPTALVAGAAKGSFLQKAVSDFYLRSWGAPGGNMFEPGAFSVGNRLVNFGYKGVVFACFGFLAGILGTSLTNGLILARKQLDPNFKGQNEAPNVFYNAGTWALHMGLSANLRYQVLGGTDRILVQVMPLTVFRIYQAAIRAVNNVVGGMTFVTLARVLGVQKSAAAALPEPPATIKEDASATKTKSKGKSK